ncbi:hypothetical protein LWI28_025875 [Acer negundo]|uniref:BTB domain-containing protein n=1 Tax=Acer negundo TaxID=4023 RepID=A0AAD5IBS1_ACENE|nr:hypothetical protein LWI28_025875 [Acer negundo]
MDQDGCAYILSYFGFYGFPSKLGKGLGKHLNMEDDTDMQLILANGESLNVHSVLLAIRCPTLLPPDEFACDKKYLALQRLLEYAYFGYLEVGNELVKKLKPLAKSCKLQPLLQLLCRKSPKWGTPVPSSDLAPALVHLGNIFRHHLGS